MTSSNCVATLLLRHNNNKRTGSFVFFLFSVGLFLVPILNGRVDCSGCEFKSYRNKWTHYTRGDVVIRDAVFAKAFSHVIFIYNLKLFIPTSVILKLRHILLIFLKNKWVFSFFLNCKTVLHCVYVKTCSLFNKWTYIYITYPRTNHYSIYIYTYIYIHTFIHLYHLFSTMIIEMKPVAVKKGDQQKPNKLTKEILDDLSWFVFITIVCLNLFHSYYYVFLIFFSAGL